MAKAKDGVACKEAEVLDEGRLLPHLAGVQMRAAEGEPAVVPLLKSADKEDESPPKAPVAKAHPAPRIVHQNERAPHGMHRYKIRCLNYGADQPTRYVLAASEDEARRHYLESAGIVAVAEAIEADGERPPTPRLIVTKLAD